MSTRILIVEDNPVVALDLSDTVIGLGHEVAGVAVTAEAASRLAAETRPDLALMDIRLEGNSDGIAAAEWIRARWQIPVVFLTAHADEETIARSAASGAFGHLTKPIRTSELKAAISIALSRHRASHELLEQNTWLGILLSGITDGILAIDTEGRIRYLNPTAERMTGWRSGEAYGRPVEEIYALSPQNGAPLSDSRIRSAARTGTAPASRERLLLRTRSGGDLLVEEKVVPLSKDGRVTGSIAVFRDLTESLKFEQAQKFETIGVLAGGVAHDFNNLLAIMIGNASMASEFVKPGSRERQFLDEVLKSGRKAADLTSQLLAYAGKGTVRKSPVDLAKAVHEMVALVRPSIPSRIAVTLKLPDGLPAIDADPGQIQQVVMNLVVNASEAIGNATGVIEISGGLKGSGLFLHVRDSGPGMDAATCSKIFDPFFTTKFMGRGLGLAAVQGIVSSHGGTIHVDTRPGHGAAFTILFPASSQRAGEAPAVNKSGGPRGSERILVVDDVESVRKFVKHALEHFGYSVQAAEGGSVALEILSARAHEFGLVLLDLSMPEMSGTETGRRIQHLFPGVPICLMSGYNEEVAANAFSEFNTASFFLQKPFTPEQLAIKIRDILDAERKQPAAAAESSVH